MAKLIISFTFTNIIATHTISVSYTAQVTPAVSIAASTNNVCNGTSITFTATPVNSGSSPIYQWKLNGNNIGTNATIFTISSLQNNDIVTCVMTPNNSCQTTATATSNSIIATIKSASTSTTNAAICASALPFIWNGNSFNNAGTFVVHLTNSKGCDSAATVVLTILSASSSTTNASTCSNQLPFIWNGNSFNNAGTFVVHLTNSKGCDSAATLVLTVLSTSSSSATINVCSNQLPYTWRGLVFNATGSQTAHLTNSVGCDSAVTLTVTVGGAVTPSVSIATASSIVFSCVMKANNTCQTDSLASSNSVTITVNASPLIGTSTVSLSTLCGIGSTTTAYNSNTSNGGVWSSKGTAVSVTTASGGAVGNVTATVASGNDTLTYTKTASNGCVAKASVAIVVTTAPTPATISSDKGHNICPGTTANLSGPTGGSWSTASTSIVTVNAITGGVTASSTGGVGNATIYYKVVSGTCSSTSSYVITVNPKPATPAVSYLVNKYYQAGAGGAYCVGDTFTVVAKVSGVYVSGKWSSSNTAIATIDSASGLMSIVGTGGGAATAITFTYTSPAGCNSSQTIPGVKAALSCPAHRGSINNETLLISSKDFMLYPNPARSTVSLQVDRLVGSGTIVVTDLYGKQVRTQALSMGTNTIDVSNLAKGFYLVSTITEQGKTTKKLVVE